MARQPSSKGWRGSPSLNLDRRPQTYREVGPPNGAWRLTADVSNYRSNLWRARQDSNLWPWASEANALSN